MPLLEVIDDVIWWHVSACRQVVVPTTTFKDNKPTLLLLEEKVSRFPTTFHQLVYPQDWH